MPCLMMLCHEKESCFAGFSACGGSQKRHLPFRRSASPAERFYITGNEVSCYIKTGKASSPPPEKLMADTVFIVSEIHVMFVVSRQVVSKGLHQICIIFFVYAYIKGF